MPESIWFVSHLIKFIHVCIIFLLVNHFMHLRCFIWIGIYNLPECLFSIASLYTEIYSFFSEEELIHCNIQNLKWNLYSEQNPPVIRCLQFSLTSRSSSCKQKASHKSCIYKQTSGHSKTFVQKMTRNRFF